MIASLKSALDIAEAKKMAIAAFNVTNLEGIQAAIAAAEALGQPLILQFCRSVHGVYTPFRDIGPVMMALAEQSRAPVCVHLDHGETFEEIREALDVGFTGVMYDGSIADKEEQAMKGIMKVNRFMEPLKMSYQEEPIPQLAPNEVLIKVKAKYTHVYKIPESIAFTHAAISEPLACATHAVDRLDIVPSQTVVIYGVGGIGLMMTQLCKAYGAGKVIVVARKDYGLGKALEGGADHVINNTDTASPYYAQDVATRVRELNGGNLAERAILATGAISALQDAINVTGACSTIVYFGQARADDRLQVPVLDCLKSEKTLKFSWLAPLVWDKVFRLIANGQVDLSKIITHEFSLEDAEKGIRFMRESRDPKVKGVIVVDPS